MANGNSTQNLRFRKLFSKKFIRTKFIDLKNEISARAGLGKKATPSGL
jgi:hypothetical protein